MTKFIISKSAYYLATVFWKARGFHAMLSIPEFGSRVRCFIIESKTFAKFRDKRNCTMNFKTFEIRFITILVSSAFHLFTEIGAETCSTGIQWRTQKAIQRMKALCYLLCHFSFAKLEIRSQSRACSAPFTYCFHVNSILQWEQLLIAPF